MSILLKYMFHSHVAICLNAFQKASTDDIGATLIAIVIVSLIVCSLVRDIARIMNIILFKNFHYNDFISFVFGATMLFFIHPFILFFMWMVMPNV